MKITDLIMKLGEREPDGYPFLSIYLNAEANEHGGEDYPVWLKKALSKEGQSYKEDPDSDEAARFGKVVERINKFVEEEADVSADGIAIFASMGDDEFFETVELDVPFRENEIFSHTRPYIFPLSRVVFQHPRYAVLWADTNKADIYVFDGEDRIRAERETGEKLESIQNTVTNRTRVGGWSQGRYQRRVDNFHLHHAKEVVDELEELLSSRHIDQLILCGDEATIMPILRPQLSKALEEKVVSSISMSQYESPKDIHERTLEVMGIENATQDKKKVEDMNDAAKAAAGLGTLGVAETLRALANGQVQELIMSSEIDSLEYTESEIEKIFEEYRPSDDEAAIEMPSTLTAGQIADQLILRALNTDAEITLIEDNSLLREAGGVGSILRYNMNASASG